MVTTSTERRQELRCGLRSTVAVGGFHIREFVLPVGYTLPAHAHAYTSIVIGKSGTYTADVDGKRHTVSKGDALVLPAGVVHQEHVGDRQTECYLIEINNARIDQLAGAGLEVGKLRSLQNPALTQLVSRLATSLTDSRPGSELELEAVVLEIVATLARTSDSLGSCVTKWLEQTWARVHEQPQRWSVRELAESAGVTPEHLSRRFRATYGLTVSECLRSRRLDLAAERVQTTAEPLARLAVSLGFADQSHFTRAFRNRFGITPGALRRCQLFKE